MTDIPATAPSGEDATVQRDYLDNAGSPTRLGDETVAALQSILGEPDPSALAAAPLVTHPGQRIDGAGDDGRLMVTLEDGRSVEVDPTMPADLPLGYHTAHCATGDRPLIVSPGSCVLPGERMWGWTAQLYATRSSTSWGIGDLRDLATLTRQAQRQGAGFVLVNPLHAGGSTAADVPQQSSPYFPSSRRFLNPLYLSVPDVDGASELGAGLERSAAAGRDLLAGRRIDRDAVWQLKRPALRGIFERVGGMRSPELTAWRRERGEAIEQFAAWCVLSERHGPNWRTWPSAVRHPGAPAVAALRHTATEDVTFVVWLQWQLERQLRAAGAILPVVQDLPVGVDPDGADAWAYQDVLADGATIGAPPDPFNLAGQNWGLPPFVPWRLRAAGYGPFIDSVRATIALSGGLRIDHVMGLFRLWWIPSGQPSSLGGYVRYPAADLLDIVALESHRAGAVVVGEDLGTVEDGVRKELAERNLLSYRLLWFEPDPPAEWPAGALAAVSTHDLPTVAGVWTGDDLDDQRAAGVDADEESTVQLRELLVDRAGVDASADVADAVDGAYRLLAQAPSLLLAASLDDGIGHSTRPNLPGTTNDTNWSTPIPVGLDDLPSHPGIRRVGAILDAAVRAPQVTSEESSPETLSE